MKISTARLFSAITLTLIGALATGCAQEPAMAPDTTADDMAAINTLRGAWETAYEAGDASALAGLYTSDTMVMFPGMATLSGRAAVEAYYAAQFGMGTVSAEITPGGTRVGGDIGYEHGTFAGTMTMADGTSMTNEGRYIVLLRRDTDGAWRIAANMDSPATTAGLQGALDQAMAAMGGGMEGGGS